MPIKIKTSTGWKDVPSIKLKVSGVWRNVTQAKLKVSGVWRNIFLSGAVSEPESTVTISQSTNSTTNLVTLTGTNKSWSPTPTSLEYEFQWYDGVGWTAISSGTITNPSSGSTNTKTYTVLNSENQISPNKENLYRFVVTSFYNGNSNSSTSSSTSIQTPRDITGLTASKNTSFPTTYLDLSGYSSLYANNYRIYQKTGSADWSLIKTISQTSTSMTGLTANTTYSFKVIPITGTNSNPGYTGNDSNIASESTDAALVPGVPSVGSVTATYNTISFNNVTFGVNTNSVGVDWSVFSDFSSIGTGAVTTNGGSFTSSAGAVLPNTLYYWRARGFNTSYGYGSATSGTITTPMQQKAPEFATDPVVTPSSGTLGSTTFSTTNGTMAANVTVPVTYSYQWQYLLNNFSYGDYPGATSSTWQPPYPFITEFWLYNIRCRVTATNSVGSASATSNQVSVNTPSPVSPPVSPPVTPPIFPSGPAKPVR